MVETILELSHSIVEITTLFIYICTLSARSRWIWRSVLTTHNDSVVSSLAMWVFVCNFIMFVILLCSFYVFQIFCLQSIKWLSSIEIKIEHYLFNISTLCSVVRFHCSLVYQVYSGLHRLTSPILVRHCNVKCRLNVVDSARLISYNSPISVGNYNVMCSLNAKI